MSTLKNFIQVNLNLQYFSIGRQKALFLSKTIVNIYIYMYIYFLYIFIYILFTVFLKNYFEEI